MDELRVSNEALELVLSRETGGIVGMTDAATGCRFVVPDGATPLYTLELTDLGRNPRVLTSADARTPDVEAAAGGVALRFLHHVDGRPLEVECRVILEPGPGLSRWRIALRNGTGLGVRTLGYPVLRAVPTLGDGDAYVSGAGFGLFAEAPGRILRTPPPPPDSEEEGFLSNQFFGSGDYPGPFTLQFQAYYGPEAGLYMATYDGAGHAKRFGYAASPARDALDLTIHHRHDETPGLNFEIAYDTVIGSFRGDWYDAADLYTEWAHRQAWCAKKLVDRDDVPGWLKEPRPHLMVISRGGVDRAQATLPCPPSEYPLGRYWPARKLVPIINRFAEAFDSPAVVWLEGWEYIGAPGGPVDIFPPYEGEESFQEATARFAEDGHVVSLYLAALHWCYRRASTGYYGEEKFEREGRPLAALNAEGDVDRFVFPSAQKHMVNLCVGSRDTRKLYLDNFMTLMDLGATWIQLDQQVGMYVYPCYSRDHGHAPGYGRWMHDDMLGFIREVRAAAKARTPDAAFTCENACEYWIQEMDGFMSRPYLQGDVLHALPVFEYVYHEYIPIYGGDMASWLYHVEASCIKHAMVCVYGLQNLVSIGEPDYDIELPEVDHPVLPLLRSIVTAQRTFARDYLVFGKMLRPRAVRTGTVPVELWWPPTAPRVRQIVKDIPKVLSSTWRAQDGRVATVLVNWTGADESVSISLDAPAAAMVGESGRSAIRPDKGAVSMSVPARTVVLLEEEDA